MHVFFLKVLCFWICACVFWNVVKSWTSQQKPTPKNVATLNQHTYCSVLFSNTFKKWIKQHGSKFDHKLELFNSHLHFFSCEIHKMAMIHILNNNLYFHNLLFTVLSSRQMISPLFDAWTAGRNLISAEKNPYNIPTVWDPVFSVRWCCSFWSVVYSVQCHCWDILGRILTLIGLHSSFQGIVSSFIGLHLLSGLQKLFNVATNAGHKPVFFEA